MTTVAKFNTTSARAKNTATSPVVTTSAAPVTNHQGGLGFARTEKSDLFLLAVSDFGGDNTFYEKGSDRADRLGALARSVAVEDADWTARFVAWLRNKANMRSSSLVVALEAAKALTDAKQPGARQIVTSALTRADEPGEALAYWHSRYGRKLPMAVKRGIADAAVKDYSEYSLAKYDSDARGYRFADVINITHPKPATDAQKALFKFALDRRYDSKAVPATELSLLTARAALLALSGEEKRVLVNNGEMTPLLSAAGLTWEALSGSLAGGMDAKAWEAVIPTMGYMALLRNLRNFDEAGISAATRKLVADKLRDPDQVAKSKQLPFRFMSAYFATPSDYWKPVLDEALELSLASIPLLQGDTEILVDTSGSMGARFSDRGTVTYAQQASLFGVALAKRVGAERIWGFDSVAKEFKLVKGANVLAEVKRFQKLVTGGATYTALAVQTVLMDRAARGLGAPARIVVISDEQIGENAYAGYGYYSRMSQPALPAVVPAETLLYTFNIGGYAYGHAESGMPNRHSFTGLNDSAFKTIPLVEQGRSADWPF
jgi:hypothetical protein